MKLFSTLFLAVALMFSAPASAEVKAVVGEMAPDFTLTDSNGVTHNLSDFKGKKVVLEWTNHECPFVVKHYHTNNMQNLQKEKTDTGVIWLTVNSSAPGKQGHTDAEQANMIISEKGSNETARLLDHDGMVGKLYGAKTTPHMYVVDAEGVLAYAGAIDDKPSALPSDVDGARNYVRDAVVALAAGSRPDPAETKPYGCSVKY